MHRRFTEVHRMTAERPLVNRAVVVAVKGHTEMLKLVNHLRRVAAHEFNGVLVAQVVRALHGVIHMPQPVVFRHIAQCRADAALGGNGVGAGGKHFRQHRRAQARF